MTINVAFYSNNFLPSLKFHRLLINRSNFLSFNISCLHFALLCRFRISLLSSKLPMYLTVSLIRIVKLGIVTGGQDCPHNVKVM